MAASPEFEAAARSPAAIYGARRLKAHGYTDEQIYGVLGSVMQESSMDPKAFNAADPNGGSIGIAQHQGIRREDLENFAAANNMDVWDYETQWEFIITELNTTEIKADSAVRNASTAGEAARAWTNLFERPHKSVTFHEKRAQYASQIKDIWLNASTGGNEYRAELADETESFSPVPLRNGFIEPKDNYSGGQDEGDRGPTAAPGEAGTFGDIADGVMGGLAGLSGLSDSSTSVGSNIGGMLGASFGPMGAIVGGVIGHAIDKSLSKNKDEDSEEGEKDDDSDKGLFGGLFGFDKDKDSEEGTDTSKSEGMFGGLGLGLGGWGAGRGTDAPDGIGADGAAPDGATGDAGDEGDDGDAAGPSGGVGNGAAGMGNDAAGGFGASRGGVR